MRVAFWVTREFSVVVANNPSYILHPFDNQRSSHPQEKQRPRTEIHRETQRRHQLPHRREFESLVFLFPFSLLRFTEIVRDREVSRKVAELRANPQPAETPASGGRGNSTVLGNYYPNMINPAKHKNNAFSDGTTKGKRFKPPSDDRQGGFFFSQEDKNWISPEAISITALRVERVRDYYLFHGC
ncbi:hypothetical protein L873DRAFT_112653 [Choiromyces venosus 120613-1]|uniref:Uncharacterized protein n=1 Tax=Choiromyces venosus 120613-1 TaxID=1336337 RepID=A0A3N4J7T0_9PEZI|nr:hypothetical protein L873DRAFT_112653 [Choiromyces venosus 120613-1]